MKWVGKMEDRKRNFGRGKRFPRKNDRPRRKLEEGVEFVDHELGVGIVRQVKEDGIVVVFGDVEKVIPRKKREDRPQKLGDKGPRKDFKGNAFEKRVFTFDVEPKEATKAPKEKGGVHVGLEVVDPVLGKGVVTTIIEETGRLYITYEKTGERIMYPQGLTPELKKSAFPNKDKAKKAAPKGKVRTYTVPTQQRGTKKVEETKGPREERDSHRNPVHHFTIQEGVAVKSSLYGPGVIEEVNETSLKVNFEGNKKEFTYPKAFLEGELFLSE